MEAVIDTGLHSVLFLCGLGSCRDILKALLKSLLEISIFKNYRIALKSLWYRLCVRMSLYMEIISD